MQKDVLPQFRGEVLDRGGHTLTIPRLIQDWADSFMKLTNLPQI